MSKLTTLAEICLAQEASVYSKQAFCSAYSRGAHKEPALIERRVYDLILQTFLEEDPKHTLVLEKAAYAIEAVLRHRPEWADVRLAEAMLSSGPPRYWKSIIEKVLTEKRPDLLAEPRPAVPEPNPQSSLGASQARLG
jgi:hypothetical protein